MTPIASHRDLLTWAMREDNKPNGKVRFSVEARQEVSGALAAMPEQPEEQPIAGYAWRGLKLKMDRENGR